MQSPNVPKIISSSLLRAQQTAEIISYDIENGEVITDKLLIEGDQLLDIARFDAAYEKYFCKFTPASSETLILVCHKKIIRHFISRYTS